MGIFQAFSGAKTRAYEECKKGLIQDSLLWAATRRGKNVNLGLESIFDDEIGSIAEQFIPKMRGETIASSVRWIPAHSKEIAEKLLDYPPEVGAYMALRTFGIFLTRNRLTQAPRANLMLAFESMFAMDRQKVEQASELLARAFCMMDSMKIALSTYSSMLDFRMKSLVQVRLLTLNQETWEEFLIQETQRTKAQVERLIEEVEDHSLLWSYRQRAIETLGNLGDQRAVEAIIAVIGDESIHTYAITDALKKLGGQKAVDALLESLSSGNELLQRDAANALGEMGDLGVLDPLMEIFRKNKECHTRKIVIRVLGKLGNERAYHLLKETLDEINRDPEMDKEDWRELTNEIKTEFDGNRSSCSNLERS